MAHGMCFSLAFEGVRWLSGAIAPQPLNWLQPEGEDPAAVAELCPVAGGAPGNVDNRAIGYASDEVKLGARAVEHRG